MIACVIPARLNSSRFPQKLLAKAKGKSILHRTMESAALCPLFTHRFVAVDGPILEEHVRELQGRPILTSPDCPNGTARIIEAMGKEALLQESDIILNLQGDHPLTSPHLMRQVVEALLNNPLAVAATAATPLASEEEFLSPHVVKCLFDRGGRALAFSRAPIPYRSWKRGFCHIGLYAYRTSFLKNLSSLPPSPIGEAEDLEQWKILEAGHPMQVVVVDEIAVGVDTYADLIRLEAYL